MEHIKNVINPSLGDYERNKELFRIPKGVRMSSNTFGVPEILRACGYDQSSDPNPGKVFSLEDLLTRVDSINLGSFEDILSSLRKNLKIKMQHPVLVEIVFEFLVEALQTDGLGDKIRPYVFAERDDNNEFTVSCLLRILDKIPNAIFFEMIINRAGIHEKKTSEFLSHEGKMRKMFLRNLGLLVSTGVLQVNLAEVKNRLSKFSINLKDPLIIEFTQRKVDGDYIFSSGQTDSLRDSINISSMVGFSEEKLVYTHEMFHAISGRTSVLFGSIPDNTNLPDSSGILVQNKGVVLPDRTGFFTNDNKIGRFFWLNEATTQSLTLLMFPKDLVNRCYVEEIELLETLLSGGGSLIPKRLLFDAYFVDNTDRNIQNTPEAMQRFYNVVDESYGVSGFLLKLDDYVSKNGVEKAIETLKTDPSLI